MRTNHINIYVARRQREDKVRYKTTWFLARNENISLDVARWMVGLGDKAYYNSNVKFFSATYGDVDFPAGARMLAVVCSRALPFDSEAKEIRGQYDYAVNTTCPVPPTHHESRPPAAAAPRITNRLFRHVPRAPSQGGTWLREQDVSLQALSLPQPVPSVRPRLPTRLHGAAQSSFGAQRSRWQQQRRSRRRRVTPSRFEYARLAWVGTCTAPAREPRYYWHGTRCRSCKSYSKYDAKGAGLYFLGVDSSCATCDVCSCRLVLRGRERVVCIYTGYAFAQVHS